jgi:hypothetical protein
MRLLAQFIGLLLLTGFVGAHFWWIAAPQDAAPVAARVAARGEGNRVSPKPGPTMFVAHSRRASD